MTVTEAPRRIALALEGRLQGVGCRPALVRLANACGLAGFVRNGPSGVEVEVEGPSAAVEAFVDRLPDVLREPARLESVRREERSVRGDRGFVVAESSGGAPGLPCLLPDAAPCADCVRELFDPSDRRYRHPFTSCASCGPRYAIATRLPFDRDATTMVDFPLCDACAREYRDPSDRRFHAQTISCPRCGPSLALLSLEGETLATREAALRSAIESLRAGLVVGLKGIGGYQLLCDARNEAAVRRLRERKARPWKPLAVMVRDAPAAEALAWLSPDEAALLASPAAPIVLARRRDGTIAPSVGPDLPTVGVMLPSSPLHHLLLQGFDGPIVCTSGNRSGAPIVLDEASACTELAGIADVLLAHDRRIVRRLDDSVVHWVAGALQVLRRGRGLAPSVLHVGVPLGTRLAVGGDLKNAFALSMDDRVLLSAHRGNLEHAAVFDAFVEDLASEPRLHRIRPETVVRDLHPDQLAHRHAGTLGLPVVSVAHHAAHVAAVMAEHRLAPPLLGVAFDGFGLGEDGSSRGGELFVVTEGGLRRTHPLRAFPLPGGDRAAREPRRALLGLLHATSGEEAFDHPLVRERFEPSELRVLARMLERGSNAPRTSSVGRLFDGVASLLGLRHRSRYEGEAAMQVELLAESWSGAAVPLPYAITDGELDFRPMLRAMLEGLAAHDDRAALARRFHATLACMVAEVAEIEGMTRVALGGGCFQNRLLVSECLGALHAVGAEVFTPREVPANDGGLAVGQLLAAALPGFPTALAPTSGGD